MKGAEKEEDARGYCGLYGKKRKERKSKEKPKKEQSSKKRKGGKRQQMQQMGHDPLGNQFQSGSMVERRRREVIMETRGRVKKDPSFIGKTQCWKAGKGTEAFSRTKNKRKDALNGESQA